jgi:SAM-dependent methyltransferase
MRATVFHHGRRLGAEDVYPASEECPVCLSRAPRDQVYQIQDSPPIHLLRCDRCGGASASLMPKEEVLDRLYASYYAGAKRKTTSPDPARFARHMAGPMGELPRDRSIRILDFGGGDGSVSSRMGEVILGRGNGPSAVAVDVVDYEPAGDSGNERVTITGHRRLEEVSGPYDIVLASAVLEHIPRVHGVMRRLFSLAAPGGYFYARTPYMLPLARLLRTIDLTYPTHVHDLGDTFWNRVVDTFSLDAEAVVSRPSLVETRFSENPLRTLAAYALKLPSHLEIALTGGRGKDTRWDFVGGWEVVLRLRG